MLKNFIEAGEIVAVHGLTGEMKLNPWCDEPSFLKGIKVCYFDEKGTAKADVQGIRPQNTMALVRLVGVDTVDTARTYIGKTLYINRNDVKLKDGRYFVQDIIGLKVIDAKTKKEYGVITDVTHPGAQDIYTIKTENDTVLFPAVAEFLDEISIE
ncbi:MAG: ribosome maturation factor RimM, partial [Oscillospiraceae bacterium]